MRKLVNKHANTNTYTLLCTHTHTKHTGKRALLTHTLPAHMTTHAHKAAGKPNFLANLIHLVTSVDKYDGQFPIGSQLSMAMNVGTANTARLEGSNC